MIFLLLALEAAIPAPLPAYAQPPIDCVVRESARLARGNTEPADAVIKAADGLCRAEWEKFESLLRAFDVAARYVPSYVPPVGTSELPVAIHREAYARAFEAIVAARSGK